MTMEKPSIELQNSERMNKHYVLRQKIKLTQGLISELARQELYSAESLVLANKLAESIEERNAEMTRFGFAKTTEDEEGEKRTIADILTIVEPHDKIEADHKVAKQRLDALLNEELALLENMLPGTVH